MLATSTHDTKRSEDVRARLAAISEIPDLWRRAVQRFRTANRKHKRDVEGEQAPDANEEYLIYQTLAGAWPLDGTITEFRHPHSGVHGQGHQGGQGQQQLDSAQRESGTPPCANSSPPSSGPAKRNNFPSSSVPWPSSSPSSARSIPSVNLSNLPLPASRISIREMNWDFSLVDPDNRRPVDYENAARRSRASPRLLPGTCLPIGETAHQAIPDSRGCCDSAAITSTYSRRATIFLSRSRESSQNRSLPSFGRMKA